MAQKLNRNTKTDFIKLDSNVKDEKRGANQMQMINKLRNEQNMR